MKTPERVSLVLMACNKCAVTRACLDALLRTDHPDLEIILVNNGSTDETGQLFDEMEPRITARGWTCRRRAFPENIGAVAGRNAAFEEVTGAFVLLMDNDVIAPEADWLLQLQDRLTREEDLGIIGPKLLYPPPLGRIQCAGCAVTPGGRVDFLGRGEPTDAPEHNRPREVQCLISACWLMRASLLESIGSLDMAFHPVQFEDIDYCYRVRDAGWRILYFPDVFLYHLENVTTAGTGGLNYRYLTVKNGLTFKRRWQHRFESEGGPRDEDIVWRDIPRLDWDEVKKFL